MRRTIITAALLVAAYLAGTVAPHASAADALGGVVSELRGIRQEIQAIRRVMDKTR